MKDQTQINEVHAMCLVQRYGVLKIYFNQMTFRVSFVALILVPVITCQGWATDIVLFGTSAAFTGPIYTARDGIGNTYVGASYYSTTTSLTLRLNQQNYTIAGNPAWAPNALLFKMNPNGGVVWTATVAGNSQELVMDVTVDEEGNVVVLFRVIDFDANLIFSNGKNGVVLEKNVFTLVKISPSGDVIWKIKLAVNSGGKELRLATDSQNNILIGGYHYSTAQFYSTQTSVQNVAGDSTYYLGFLCKYSPTGNFQWISRVNYTNSGFNSFLLTDVVTDGQNNIYMAGYFTTSFITFSSRNFTSQLVLNGYSSSSLRCGYAVKYSADGVVEWAKSVKSNGNNVDSIFIGADSEGSFYLGFDAFTPATLNGTTQGWTYSLDVTGVVVTKFSANDDYLWNVKVDGSGWQTLKAMAVSRSGDVVTGMTGSIYSHDFFNSSSANPTARLLSTNPNSTSPFGAFGSSGNVKATGRIRLDTGSTLQFQSVSVDRFGNALFLAPLSHSMTMSFEVNNAITPYTVKNIAGFPVLWNVPFNNFYLDVSSAPSTLCTFQANSGTLSLVSLQPNVSFEPLALSNVYDNRIDILCIANSTCSISVGYSVVKSFWRYLYGEFNFVYTADVSSIYNVSPQSCQPVSNTTQLNSPPIVSSVSSLAAQASTSSSIPIHSSPSTVSFTSTRSTSKRETIESGRSPDTNPTLSLPIILTRPTSETSEESSTDSSPSSSFDVTETPQTTITSDGASGEEFSLLGLSGTVLYIAIGAIGWTVSVTIIMVIFFVNRRRKRKQKMANMNFEVITATYTVDTNLYSVVSSTNTDQSTLVNTNTASTGMGWIKD